MVIVSRSRAVMAVGLCLALPGVVLLPPEHVHASDPDHHGVPEFHRHVSAHHHAPSGAAVDHEDGDAVWIPSPYVASRPASSVVRLALAVHALPPVIAARGVSARIAATRASGTHDPPPGGPAGPRAPPAPFL